MLSVQVDVRPLRFPASHVAIPPPVGVRCQSMAGVFVQSVVELVLGESSDHTNDQNDGPIGSYERKELVCQHVEVRLALGGVERSYKALVFDGGRETMDGSYTCLYVLSAYGTPSGPAVVLARSRQIEKAGISVLRQVEMRERYCTALGVPD